MPYTPDFNYPGSDTVIHSDDFKAVIKEMKKAEKKHPLFPTDFVKMTAIMVEEAGESLREANLLDEGNGTLEQLKSEIYQTIGVCFRELNELRRQNEKTDRSHSSM